MALVDYRGFRIIAMSILPISATTLVSGSSDAGRTVYASCEEMNLKLKKAAKKANSFQPSVLLRTFPLNLAYSVQLNLDPHVCGTRAENTEFLYSATDLEGHIGSVLSFGSSANFGSASYFPFAV